VTLNSSNPGLAYDDLSADSFAAHVIRSTILVLAESVSQPPSCVVCPHLELVLMSSLDHSRNLNPRMIENTMQHTNGVKPVRPYTASVRSRHSATTRRLQELQEFLFNVVLTP
jgi:hypothetical protein